MKLLKTLFAVFLMVNMMTCNIDEDLPIEENPTSWTITIGVFTLNNGGYTAVGNELVFDSAEDCQTWSRTAQGDSHDSNNHLHYNAASEVSYDEITSTFSWTEYGPEVDQSAIEANCAAGVDGVRKTVNEVTYYEDKPNVYLKIMSVVEN